MTSTRGSIFGFKCFLFSYHNWKIGRNPSPIRIKLVPYSATLSRLESKSVETSEENFKNSSMRNVIGEEEKEKLFSHSYKVGEILTSNSSPLPKLSCSPSSSVISNSNNKTSSRNHYRQNCYDKIAKSSFADQVEKPTSSFNTPNGAKLRAAKSESSLRAMLQQQLTLLNDRDQDQVRRQNFYIVLHKFLGKFSILTGILLSE